MNLFTQVTLPPKIITLVPHSNIMFIGSCFAEHVGVQIQQRMGETNCDVNPFGVLYNPVSIAQGIDMLINFSIYRQRITENIFLGQDNIHHSWLHTSHFSDTDKEKCLEKILHRMEQAHNRLLSADVLCVTFGTTRYYELKEPPHTIVANCHKEPQKIFIEKEPTLEELLALWQQTLDSLYRANPKLTVCFTVSPYRYRKYGFHESQIQKSKLLILADTFCKTYKQTAYFPAYEIMMDELRDYRFYAIDMLHPSEQAISIITERFTEWTFSKEMTDVAEQRIKEWKQKQHRAIMR